MSSEAALVARWQKVGASMGAASNQRLLKGVQIRTEVIGDEELVYRLSTGPGELARVFKLMRRAVATRTVVPIVRREIPRSNLNKQHLQSTFRVRYARLEGTWVAAGTRKLFYGAALNAKDPWLLRGLEKAERPYLDDYSHALGQFTRWLATGKPIRLRRI